MISTSKAGDLWQFAGQKIVSNIKYVANKVTKHNKSKNVAYILLVLRKVFFILNAVLLFSFLINLKNIKGNINRINNPILSDNIVNIKKMAIP